MSGWHLEYDIDIGITDRIVYEKIFGVWKISTAESYKQDFKVEVTPLIKKPWAKLCDLSNWKIAYPEVVDIIGEHLVWCREHNMIWSVNIINNPATFRLLHQMFEKGGTKEISQTFRSRPEAVAFLKRQKFLVRSSGSSARPPLGL
ncbi:MAG: hypothetical protein U9R56_04860 [candidate division Zixibacteria bacterium]|nr:hypothetical protein [candidate division Zixibacteria bacterium]